jgi:hypothetical protein
MPASTFIVDPATFASAIVMATAPKEVFGQPGNQDVNAQGEKKWTAQVAVSYAPDQNSMTAPAEVLNVSVAGEDPGVACPPGTPVSFDRLRAGLNPPEKRDNGTIRGGRLWYSAAGIRPVQSWSKKSDAA